MTSVSIIVPVYKVEQYLPRCVDSILQQTFTDFELILVDDGSPDGCGAICDEYAKRDGRIHVIHQPNGGLSAARNAGLDWTFAERGSEWIGFVDSDDWIHPRMYEILYRIATENDTKISVCDFVRTDGKEALPEVVDSPAAVCDGLDLFCSDRNVMATVAWNKLYRKELFEGLRYPVGKIHEDEFLTYRLLHRAGAVACTEAKLYYYFQNDAGIMRRPYTLKRLDAIEGVEQQFRYIQANGTPAQKQFMIKHLIGCTGVHYANVVSIGEMKVAHRLKRRTRALIRQEGKDLFKDPIPNYTLLLPYFPHRTEWACRMARLRERLKNEPLRSTVQFYLRKILKKGE